MKKIIIPILLLVFTLVCFAPWPAFSEGQGRQDATTQTTPKYDQPLQRFDKGSPLALTIKSDKQVYEAGENAIIELKLQNVGKQNITICNMWLPTVTVGIWVSYNGKEIYPIPVKYPFAVLTKENFVELKPGESIVERLNISAYIPTNKIGVYNFRLSYENEDEWHYDDSASKYKDIAWCGSVASNTLQIEVVEKRAKLSVSEAEGLVRDNIFKEKPGMNSPEFKLSLRELTTEEIWNRLGAQIFKAKEYSFAGSSLGKHPTYLIKDKEVLLLGESWGGSGVMSMCVADLDQDNQPELLYTYSWGSGMHRTHVALFSKFQGRSKIVEWGYVYGHGDLFLKKIDDENVIVEIGEFKDYQKGTYAPVANLGRVFLSYLKNEEPIVVIEFDKNLPEERRKNIWSKIHDKKRLEQ